MYSVLRGIKHAAITFSPHELRMGEVVLAILTMAMKSIFGTTRSTVVQPLHESTLSSPFRITKQDFTRYHAATGSGMEAKNTINSSALPLFLSAVTEPAMLLLLTSPRCPINSLGAVNVENRFEVLRPELYHLETFMGRHAAALVAKLGNEARLVKQGMDYDLEFSIMVPDYTSENRGDLVTVFRQVFTTLEFKKANASESEKVEEERNEESQAQTSSERSIKMSFSGSDPLKWAALCKDYNFIQFSRLAAKLFGLPGKLAHGNHVVAKSIQALEEEVVLAEVVNQPMWMEVQFKRPVVVPCTIDAKEDLTKTRLPGFIVSTHDRECLIADCGFL